MRGDQHVHRNGPELRITRPTRSALRVRVQSPSASPPSPVDPSRSLDLKRFHSYWQSRLSESTRLEPGAIKLACFENMGIYGTLRDEFHHHQPAVTGSSPSLQLNTDHSGEPPAI